MSEQSMLACTFIRDERGHCLLVQENGRDEIRGLWGFPGGHVEEGETLRGAAIRETREETGLDVAIEGDEPVFEGETRNHELLRVYAAHVIGGELKADDSELMGLGYFSRKHAEELSASGGMRDPLIMLTILKVEQSANSRH